MLTLYMVFGTAFCYYYYLLLAALPSSVLVDAAIKSAKNAANPEPARHICSQTDNARVRVCVCVCVWGSKRRDAI
ncbi:hypothetical protein LSTR_LSTR011341 [Laodelphax striatellus]|uniref:Uncharacterized protein n=1 Tax=Laodelphax striatellus TaxID=195883 RepID=A0A482XVR7_LAOST|nr:hypothetical protein LSTR_LSTR011341 [Laodelphax striatellus]